MASGHVAARLVADTRIAPRPTVSSGHDARASSQVDESNFFRGSQFTADGTTIITHNEDHSLRTFVLPSDLLDDEEQQVPLTPHATYPSPSPLRSYTPYPFFNLPDPSTTLVLSSIADQPFMLRNALDYSTIHAQYPLVSPMTEDYLPGYSLAFSRGGDHFVAGSDDSLYVFDCSRPNEPPVFSHRRRSKKAQKLYGQLPGNGCRGLFTALDISDDGVLAVGTTAREIGLYANEGRGECLTAFSVVSGYDPEHRVKGTGVMQVKWSPDGMYLLVAERQSDVIQVWDVRYTRKRLAWLSGREAETTQRLGMDLVPTVEGLEVWAGGTDGCVRMWSKPGMMGDIQAPDAEIKLHDDPISSSIWHPTGAVLATCSGQRSPVNSWDDHGSDEGIASGGRDTRLAIWTVAGTVPVL